MGKRIVELDGNIFIKQPVPSIEGNLGNMPDVWLPIEKSGLVPVQEKYVLDNDNHIKVVNWLDLSKFKGAKIYVGFGTTESSMRVDKIVTL